MSVESLRFPEFFFFMLFCLLCLSGTLTECDTIFLEVEVNENNRAQRQPEKELEYSFIAEGSRKRSAVSWS